MTWAEIKPTFTGDFDLYNRDGQLLDLYSMNRIDFARCKNADILELQCCNNTLEVRLDVAI